MGLFFGGGLQLVVPAPGSAHAGADIFVATHDPGIDNVPESLISLFSRWSPRRDGCAYFPLRHIAGRLK
jgi:hypothetical protein